MYFYVYANTVAFLQNVSFILVQILLCKPLSTFFFPFVYSLYTLLCAYHSANKQPTKLHIFFDLCK